jgi:IS5 family transposase
VIRYTRLLRDIATALNCAITEPNVQGAAATLWIQWHKPAKGGY